MSQLEVPYLFDSGELSHLVSVVRSTADPTKASDEAATKILMDFSYRQARGTAHEPAVLSWLADVADDVLEHRDARGAFRLLSRERGRPRDHDAQLDYAIWVHLAQRRGLSHASAIAEAAIAFGRDDSSIRRSIQGDAGRVEFVDEAWYEEHFARTGRSLPPGTGSK
jgi:hypothetical protein